MTEKAVRGEYQAFPPFGYNKIKGNKGLTINNHEAEYVKYIFEEYINNVSFCAIAKKLNCMGVLTKKGNKFESRSIKYILQNPVYKGYASWTPTGRKKLNFNSPDTIIKKSQHEAIISEKEFDIVQSKISENKKKYKQKKRSPEEYKHYLSGLIKCSSCGNTLVKCGNIYFQCSGYLKGKCHDSHTLKISYAEEAVIKELDNHLKISLYKIISVKNNFSENTRNIITSEIKNSDKKLEKIKRSYLNGIDTFEEYSNFKKQLSEQKSILHNELELINSKYNTSLNNICINSVKELLNCNTFTTANKSQAIHDLIDKIIYDKENNTFTYYFFC